MNMMRGMGAIAGAIAEHEKERASQVFLRFMKLESGETAQFIALGTPDTEPVGVKKHNFRQPVNGSFSMVHREHECVACYKMTNGDRSIGRPAPKFHVSLFDLRWVKKVLNEEKSAQSGQDRFDYVPIDEDEVTSKGRARKVHLRRGVCCWEMGSQWAAVWRTHEEEQRKKCKSCLRGKIKLSGYETAEGKPFRTASVTSGKLARMVASGKVVEKIECSHCENPVRRSLFNSVFTITKSGSKTSTTYQIQIQPEEEIPEDVTALLESGDQNAPKAYDWESILAEPSPESQAQALRVRNPFKKGAAADDAEEYGEEEEEEEGDDDVDVFGDSDTDDDDDTDDGDEDEKPLKKKVSVKKPLKKKVASKKNVVTKKPLKKKVAGGVLSGLKKRAG